LSVNLAGACSRLGQGTVRDQGSSALGAEWSKKASNSLCTLPPAKAELGRDQRGQGQLAGSSEGLGVIGVAGPLGKSRALGTPQSRQAKPETKNRNNEPPVIFYKQKT
jgi:hypothetical protein